MPRKENNPKENNRRENNRKGLGNVECQGKEKFHSQPLCTQPDIPLWPLPNNFYTHLSPTLSATPIKYEGYLAMHLASPTLDTQTLPQGLDEDQ
jgi:hypothetical protein